MLAIELKLCVVIATVDDVRNLRRTRDVEDEKTNPGRHAASYNRECGAVREFCQGTHCS